MQTGFSKPENFEKSFSIQHTQAPANTEVLEAQSGHTHLLKSADSGVSYKNLNESNIEETHLLQDAYNRAIITDHTDQYDPGVITSHTETAPQINKRTILADAYNATADNVTETVNTADHRETLSLDQNVFTQNKQESIPTNLKQKMSNFGGLATKALKRKVSKKDVKAQQHVSNFNQAKIKSSGTTISGKGSIQAKNIVILDHQVF